jgi:cholesterol transport system auxiliary component
MRWKSMSKGSDLSFTHIFTQNSFKIALIIMASALTACAGGEAPKALYDITAPRSIDTGGASTGRQLLVPTPLAVSAYDTDRIVVRSGELALSYYPDAQWADRLPNLLRARLVESFEATGRVRAVGVPGQGLLINYQVISEIRAFDVQVQNGPTRAVVQITIKLMNDANGRIVDTKTFISEAPASSDSSEAGVNALNAAFDQVSGEIVRWTLRRL